MKHLTEIELDREIEDAQKADETVLSGHCPRLYHQRIVQYKRCDWLDCAVIVTDPTNLTITRSVSVPSERPNVEILHEIDPNEKGLHLNVSAHVDGNAKHPLGVVITSGAMREPTQFEHLQTDVKVFFQTSTRRFMFSTVASLIASGFVISTNVVLISFISSKLI